MTLKDRFKSWGWGSKPQIVETAARTSLAPELVPSESNLSFPEAVQRKVEEFPQIEFVLRRNDYNIVLRVERYPRLANWISEEVDAAIKALGEQASENELYVRFKDRLKYPKDDFRIQQKYAENLDFDPYTQISYSLSDDGKGFVEFIGGSVRGSLEEARLYITREDNKVELKCKTHDETIYGGREFLLTSIKTYITPYIGTHKSIVVSFNGGEELFKFEATKQEDKFILRSLESADCIKYPFAVKYPASQGEALLGDEIPEAISAYKNDYLLATIMMLLPLADAAHEPEALVRSRRLGIARWQAEFEKLGKVPHSARERMTQFDWATILKVARLPYESGGGGSGGVAAIGPNSDPSPSGGSAAQLRELFKSPRQPTPKDDLER